VVARVPKAADAMARKLDKLYGVSATYKVPTGSTTDAAGNTTLPYIDTPVVVRSAGLSSVELAALAQNGLGQVDAVWKMRKHYVSEVATGHIIQIGSWLYTVIERGATLDAMQLLWIIATRRRR
jgi:hypothetical protein